MPDGENASTQQTPEEARIRKLEERMLDMVDVRELRELVDKWRNDVDEYPDDVRGQYAEAAVLSCADELEEVFDDV